MVIYNNLIEDKGVLKYVKIGRLFILVIVFKKGGKLKCH